MGRGSSSGRWRARQAADSYVHKRQTDGFRSRAAYKLQELDQREKLLAPGMRVIDLGAAPGGWTQVAAQRVGPKGTVLAVDVLKMEPVAGATVITGDCRDEGVAAQIAHELDGRRADLVLSDMSPNITGIRLTDEARHEELAYMALQFAELYLHEGGSMLIKMFEFGETATIINDFKRQFGAVARRKPPASRSASREFYVVAKRFGL